MPDNTRFLDADAAARAVPDGAVLALTGSGGGILEADHVFAALERRFLSEGHPRDLTVVHGLGIGDGPTTGMSRFAHEGMVKRVIGGHWARPPVPRGATRSVHLPDVRSSPGRNP